MCLRVYVYLQNTPHRAQEMPTGECQSYYPVDLNLCVRPYALAAREYLQFVRI